MRLHARKQITFFNNEEDRQKRKDYQIIIWFHVGDNLLMEQRFVWHYGSNIYIGENFHAIIMYHVECLRNYTLRQTMIGPNCQFLTPLHPRCERNVFWFGIWSANNYW